MIIFSHNFSRPAFTTQIGRWTGRTSTLYDCCRAVQLLISNAFFFWAPWAMLERFSGHTLRRSHAEAREPAGFRNGCKYSSKRKVHTKSWLNHLNHSFLFVVQILISISLFLSCPSKSSLGFNALIGGRGHCLRIGSFARCLQQYKESGLTQNEKKRARIKQIRDENS